MTFIFGQIVEHKKLGAVTVLGEEIWGGRIRVAVLDEWQATPFGLLTRPRERWRQAHVDFPCKVHVVDPETLTARPRRDGDVAEFMRTHRTPGWKPPSLPRSRRLRKLPDERFEALMREQGARRIS